MTAKKDLRAKGADKSSAPEKGKFAIRCISGTGIILLTLGIIFGGHLALTAFGEYWQSSFFAGKWPFVIFVAFLAAVAVFEWSRMILKKQKTPLFIVHAILAALAIVATGLGHTPTFMPVLVLGLSIFIYMNAGFRGVRENKDKLAGGFFYILFLLSFLVILAGYIGRFVPGPLGDERLIAIEPLHLKIAIAALFVTVWASDSMAYVFGRFIGGPKLAPSISPKKTWAGLVGSMTGAGGALILTAYIFLHQFDPVFKFPPLYSFFLYGAFLGIVGQIGDLTVSVFKRSHNMKDTGALIPGHGGVLDRIDALMLITPFYYLGFIQLF